MCIVLPLQVIAVANDITAQAGAFGPREDALFRAAGELALKERLPLIYLAANSGARVGVALEVCTGKGSFLYHVSHASPLPMWLVLSRSFARAAWAGPACFSIGRVVIKVVLCGCWCLATGA
jgi:acetyl-CoA carboxylase carboxyltransferase component